ncbi:MAG: alpha/beta hydrolase [Bacteroidia bacterium]
MNFKPLVFLLLGAILFSCSNKKPVQKGVESKKVGNIDTYKNFESSTNILPRNIDVWIPDGIKTGTKMQVLYMHDGQNLFNPETSYGGESWEIDVTLQKLIDQKKIPPTMVVGIWNTSDRTIDYTPYIPFTYLNQMVVDSLKQINRISQAPKSTEYLSFIVNELKPFIDSIYPTLTQKEHTFISGSSMGGLISLYAQVNYPNFFGGAACLSTHWPLGLVNACVVITSNIH